ncbi:hypothetical protein FPF71_16580 [Algibacter amylolyticus]|uniref:Uncharacterized protein n=1 Tax=Algibacter amylolyticus TaxID=1608400 RepID=A0A5M7B2P6_9FLAO|nr:hypothetical protein [Algibacter amylolyticus]KAA5821491.1 hypothetical protein F2B50_16580 [Algibacter amylolyticus]MBB5268368.1 hypothetical protein [Algibacter amylolyticus]TSJ73003.1 hypothetical protein FPF71_16580 [Algibacter amylolyticus]
MKVFYVLVLTMFIGGTTLQKNGSTINTKNCSATLTVHKHRSFKSATENGAEFILTGASMLSALQDVQLTIIEKSDKPNTEKIHFYILQVANNTSDSITFTLTSENIDCNEESFELQTDFNFEFYNLNQTEQISEVTVANNSAVKFYMKKITPESAQKSAWNCARIEASNAEGNYTSSITMKSLVQDPTKVN